MSQSLSTSSDTAEEEEEEEDTVVKIISSSIVHRDIKPENIKINKDGEPIILDMGI